MDEVKIHGLVRNMAQKFRDGASAAAAAAAVIYVCYYRVSFLRPPVTQEIFGDKLKLIPTVCLASGLNAGSLLIQ